MKDPILVTGSHRSGTTWVGKILSSLPNIRYVHEPFNLSIGYQGSPIKYFLEYIDSDMDPEYQDEMERYLRSFESLHYKDILKTNLPVSNILQVPKDIIQRIGSRSLFKDPIAIMSIEWLYYRFNFKTIILIRHPAAFIASLKVKAWEFDFNYLLEQKNLLDKHLHEYSDSIEYAVQNPLSIIEQGILLWNIIYSRISDYKHSFNGDWYFVRHEDLSQNPIEEFLKMFNYLNMDFEKVAIDKICKTTTSKRTDKIHRNSKENIKTWKNRLSSKEIKVIYEKTRPVWKEFYTEADW